MDDQIIKYINYCKGKSISDVEIIKSLTIHGWPIEKIKSLLNDTNPKQPIPISKHTSLFSKSKFLLILLLLFIFVGGLIIAYIFLNSRTIIDKKYGFKFTNIQGWEKTNSRKNEYLSLATIKNKKFIFSHLNLSIGQNNMFEKFTTKMLNEDNTKVYSTKCKDTDKKYGFKYLGIEKINIHGTNSYKCKSEGNSTNTNENILVMEDYFIIKPKYNLIISITYNKNLPEEAEKVKKLMDGFQIID